MVFFEVPIHLPNTHVKQSEEVVAISCARYLTPGPTKPSKPPEPANWYQTCLGRLQR